MKTRQQGITILGMTLVVTSVLLIACSSGEATVDDGMRATTDTNTASQQPALEIATTGQSPRTYIVQEGDTLGHIAESHGISLDAILMANDVPNPDLILVGQVLVLPDN